MNGEKSNKLFENKKERKGIIIKKYKDFELVKQLPSCYLSLSYHIVKGRAVRVRCFRNFQESLTSDHATCDLRSTCWLFQLC